MFTDSERFAIISMKDFDNYKQLEKNLDDAAKRFKLADTCWKSRVKQDSDTITRLQTDNDKLRTEKAKLLKMVGDVRNTVNASNKYHRYYVFMWAANNCGNGMYRCAGNITEHYNYVDRVWKDVGVCGTNEETIKSKLGIDFAGPYYCEYSARNAYPSLK